jgi:tetratricopeptide (TPR) repeat protein
LLAAIVWIVFGQTLRHEFVNYDDNEYVYENPSVSAGLTAKGIPWAFSAVYANNWHPLTTLSHMLDCQLYGLQPWGHHRTNVWLHAAAALLLFLALRRLTGALWPSALVAALFAIHPLHVGSVAWISERKDVLSGVFFMLILLAYARFAQSGRASGSRYFVVLVLFVLGLMCKPTLVTLPFVLLLLDYWPLQRMASAGGTSLKQWSHLILEKVPLLAFSAASCSITILAQGRALIPVSDLTFVQRAGNAAVAYVVYLVQTVYPVRLAVIYPYPEGHVNLAQAIMAFLFLSLLSALFFLWRKQCPFLLVGWLWFLGMLVPMIGLVQVGSQPHADRYTYLPQIGLFLIVIWSVTAIAEKWHVPRVATAVAALGVVMAFMAVSYLQASCWQNSETLWREALANTANNQVAENNLGDVLVHQQRFDEALVHFQNALRIYPNYAEASNNLGYVLASKGKWPEAIVCYQAALRLLPSFPRAHHNLGVSLAETGRMDEAINHFREALRLDPGLVDAHYNLASVLLQLGRREEAIFHLNEALRLKPGDTEVREQLRALGASK